MKKSIILLTIFTFCLANLIAQPYTHYSIISSAGKWDSNSNYKHYYVFGEPMVSNLVTAGSLRTVIGFLSPDSVDPADGVEVIFQDIRIQAYPNPTQGLLQLKGENLDYESSDIRLMNILGEELFHLKLSPSETLNEQINFEGLSQGLYMLKITRGNQISVYKVIKE